MRITRFRFTIRTTLILVVVVVLISLIVALGVVLHQMFRIPTTPAEALTYTICRMKLQSPTGRLGFSDYDAEVRRWRPEVPVGSQYGVTFRIRFTKRDNRGKVIDRVIIWLTEDGYCMRPAGDASDIDFTDSAR